MSLQKFLTLGFVVIIIIFSSLIFGQILGEYYIYSLFLADNPMQVEVVERMMILRLEPIAFYTLQVGVFADLSQAEKVVDQLNLLHLQPYITNKAPYKICLGCFSDQSKAEQWVMELKKRDYEVFVGEGLINDRALRFKEDNYWWSESLAPLLREYDSLFKNALQMFCGPNIGDHNVQVWDQMTNKMNEDIKILADLTDQALMNDEHQLLKSSLLNLVERLGSWEESLWQLKDTKNDQNVLNSQSRLLEMIADYHNLIIEANKIAEIN